MTTMQSVVDRGRDPLNDDAKVRWTDARLLGYAVDALLMVRQKRCDLFVGNWSASLTGLALTDTFPIDDSFLPIIANYVTGRASLRDDEAADQGRAAAFLASFLSSLGVSA